MRRWLISGVRAGLSTFTLTSQKLRLEYKCEFTILQILQLPMSPCARSTLTHKLFEQSNPIVSLLPKLPQQHRFHRSWGLELTIQSKAFAAVSKWTSGFWGAMTGIFLEFWSYQLRSDSEMLSHLCHFLFCLIASIVYGNFPQAKPWTELDGIRRKEEGVTESKRGGKRFVPERRWCGPSSPRNWPGTRPSEHKSGLPCQPSKSSSLWLSPRPTGRGCPRCGTSNLGCGTNHQFNSHVDQFKAKSRVQLNTISLRTEKWHQQGLH
jgi:hypothetical protein